MTTQAEISQADYLHARNIVSGLDSPRGAHTALAQMEAMDEARRVVVAYRSATWPDGQIPDWAR